MKGFLIVTDIGIANRLSQILIWILNLMNPIIDIVIAEIILRPIEHEASEKTGENLSWHSNA